MKSLNFPDGFEDYRLNDRVTVRFNPTDVSSLEKLASAFEKMDTLTPGHNKAPALWRGRYDNQPV